MKYYSQTPPKLVGFDTETDVNGDITVLACSDGSYLCGATTDEMIDFLVAKTNKKTGVFWNLDFDASAIFKKYLVQHHKLPSSVTYYQHVQLSIKRDRTHNFYDVNNFFNITLKDAAERYLGETKENIESTTDIVQHCITDAKLTCKLGAFVIKNVYEIIKVYPRKLTTEASLAKAYLQRYHPDVFHSMIKRSKFGKYSPYKPEGFELNTFVNFLQTAYKGPINDVSMLGRVENVTEIDINNAYGEALLQLHKIKNNKGTPVTHPTPDKECYGLYDCVVEIPQIHIGFKLRDVSVYPMEGKKEIVLTRSEYMYLTTIGTKITVLGGVEFDVEREREFYDIHSLLALRTEEKTKYTDTGIAAHKWRADIIKKLVVSIYGVLTQNKHGISDFTNFIYASEITALVRIKIWEMEQKIGIENIVKINTDSIMFVDTGQLSKIDITGWKVEFQKCTGYIYDSGIYMIMQNSEIVKFKHRTFKSLTPEVLLGASGKTIVLNEPYIPTISSTTKYQEVCQFQTREIPFDLDMNLRKRNWIRSELKFDVLNNHTIVSLPVVSDEI